MVIIVLPMRIWPDCLSITCLISFGEGEYSHTSRESQRERDDVKIK